MAYWLGQMVLKEEHKAEVIFAVLTSQIETITHRERVLFGSE